MKTFQRLNNRHLNITVLGGCHVLGFMVGKENGFVTVCSEKLKAHHIANTTNVFAYFNLKLAKDVQRVCEKTQPDVLIIQCHYIFNPYLFKPIRELLGGRKKKIHKPYDLQKQYSDCRIANTDTTFTPTFKFWLQQYAKHFLHSLLFYKVVSKKKRLSYIHNFFEEIKKAGIKNVIVLSSLPSADIVVNRYRKLGSELLYEKSLEFGFDFIDVFSAIKSKYNNQSFTIEDCHLHKSAHHFLGEILADYLVKHKLERSKYVPGVAS